MSKYILAYSISTPIDSTPIDVEFYHTYSLVRQINEDDENPEYETMLEIDHHNDESNSDEHELTNDDIDQIVDSVFSADDIQSLISGLTSMEQELIHRHVAYRTRLYEILKSSKEERQKTAEEIYNNSKSNFDNLMENSINLSAFNTNETIINCPVSATLNYSYTWKNIYYPGTDNESTESYTSDYNFSFTSGEIIRNEDVTWEEILQNEKEYERLKEYTFAYKDEISNYYSTLDDFYRIRATGKYKSSEYDGSPGGIRCT